VAYSLVRYTGNGTTASYTFPFQYISSDHVKVKVNGVVAVFTFLNANTVTIAPTPPSGSIIEIKRDTPKTTPIVNFTDGSVLLERDLDLLALFDLYIAQEAADAVADTISSDSIGRWDAQAKRLGNLAPAIAPDEAVIKQTLDYEYPAVAVVAGARSDLAIVASDLGVETGIVTDLGLITESIDSNPGTGTSYIVTVADNIADIQSVADNITVIQDADANAASALASATAAASSASSALSSKNAAATSETNALTSKNAAATSATQAATSASSAATSASTATGQASAASGSATTASTAASNAATAATQAASSASNASTSATNAASSANSAASSATSASTSAGTATSQASAASTSAGNAAASATAAASSASSASSSATTATSQAAVATTKATDAATSATSAAASATTATTQASNASTSATNAASSATSAAASAASAAALLDNFDDRYLGPKASAPTLDNGGNALVIGALYFDTTAGKMRVYTATGWVDATSMSQAALTVYRFTATAGQTTFSGTSSNGTILSYLAGGLVVSLNGVVLVGGGDDYTATNGVSVVLTSGAAVGDILEVYAFSSFSIASVNGSALVASSVTTDKLADLDFGTLS
jgi:hypothetical protein